MVLGGERPNAVKEFLRSTLRAWYELTQHSARNFATGAVASEQQQLETPEQVERLILSVLFIGWKLHALNPCAREQRNRVNSNSTWVQRMVAPTPARGEGVPSTAESGEVLASLEVSRDGHPLGSRYMRVCTIPPDRIRYGRSPATPAAPVPTPPRRTARSRIASRVAVHRSSRPGKHRAKNVSAAPTSPNGSMPNGHIDLPHETSEQDEDYRRHNNSNNKIGDGESLDSMESNMSSGSRNGTGGRGVTCPLSWDDMHPWEQRNACLLMCGGGGVKANASEESSISAEVLREVSNRLMHHAHLEARQTNALALCREAGISRADAPLPGSTARMASNTYCRSGKRSRKGKKGGSTRAVGSSSSTRRGNTKFEDDTRSAIFGRVAYLRPGEVSTAERDEGWL